MRLDAALVHIGASMPVQSAGSSRRMKPVPRMSRMLSMGSSRARRCAISTTARSALP
jgi:hypothetical protein